ncbi:MAG TPA: transglycosylase domain-containing protein [Mycobacteriales bacterium]|nr:transglycosylase domain-containing protein [Mycobacteriales bacterium]
MDRPGVVLVHRLTLVVVVCLVMGVLLAGAVFPFVGSVGVALGSGAKSFSELPQELIEPPLPQRSRILAADGSVLAAVYFNEDRVTVPLERIPSHVQSAIVSVEDERFREHRGVDLRGLTRAFITNQQAGGVQQGGSTITQQYVKNVLITSARDAQSRRRATERSVPRKLREARYAMALEDRYTKDEILERYLNIAYFGQGVYGVGTAAQRYFSKPIERVNVMEGALLAGLVQAPERYDPIVAPTAARDRRDIVLASMERTGALAPRDAAWARRQPLRLKPSKVSGIEDSPLAGPFLDLVRTAVIGGADPQVRAIFGETAAAREQALFQGGLTVRTTLDPKVQRTALETLRDTLGDADDPASAVVVVEPGTGRVKAMASLNHERLTQKVNLPIGGTSGFQAGSTFKAYVLAAAIEQGIATTTRFYAPTRYRSKIYTNTVDGVTEPYEVGNAGDSESGTFDLVTGTAHSVNTFYLQLQEKTGFKRPAEIARKAGLTRFPLKVLPSFTLGATEVSPLDLASSYATFAAHGMACVPQVITSVQHADGTTAGTVAPTCERALDAAVADTVTSVLQEVITDGTGGAADFGRPLAGKTGTTNGPSAAWFVGYTPQLASAVWVGHPTNPIERVLRDVHGVPIVYGGTFPARIFRAVMSSAHERLPVALFDLASPPPTSKLVGGPDRERRSPRRRRPPDESVVRPNSAEPVPPDPKPEPQTTPSPRPQPQPSARPSDPPPPSEQPSPQPPQGSPEPQPSGSPA